MTGVEEWERVLKIDLNGPFLCAARWRRIW